ncbi:MAG TPA: hypothetical protein VM510_11895, partial [Caulifigura sp.]|nr:hypothetical protein [Caulifigura sp.]
MNSITILLCLISTLPESAAVEAGPSSAIFGSVLELGDESPVVRGQSPGQPIAPLLDQNTTWYQPTYQPDPNAAFSQGGQTPFVTPQPYGMPQPIGSGDPFLNGGMPYAAPSPNAPWGQYSYGGINGAQPVRYGWNARYDFTYMPAQGTSSPDVGKLSIFGFDLEKDYIKPLPGSWVFSFAPQYNLRLLDGPSDGYAGPSHLPGDLHRFGLGLKLSTPEVYGSSFEVGFTPAFTTDFNIAASAANMQYDAHAVWFWRWTPQFMVALGAAYWDRVDNIVLPYAGIVYTPNDYLEFRLLFPKPRVSLFLGTPNGVATWAYVQGEYHVESYSMELSPGSSRDQVQFTDWRVLGGLRFESGWLT